MLVCSKNLTWWSANDVHIVIAKYRDSPPEDCLPLSHLNEYYMLAYGENNRNLYADFELKSPLNRSSAILISKNSNTFLWDQERASKTFQWRNRDTVHCRSWNILIGIFRTFSNSLGTFSTGWTQQLTLINNGRVFKINTVCSACIRFFSFEKACACYSTNAKHKKKESYLYFKKWVILLNLKFIASKSFILNRAIESRLINNASAMVMHDQFLPRNFQMHIDVRMKLPPVSTSRSE